MLPKTVLHKRNGHAHHPKPHAAPADMLRLVHGARDEGFRLTPDLLKFAHLVRTERLATLFAQAARDIDGVSVALGEALAETDAALAAGDLSDVRALFDGFRAEAQAVQDTVARLVATASSRAAEFQVVDVNEIVARAVGLLRYRLGDRVQVLYVAEARLPPVAASATDLERVLVTLVSEAAARAREGVAPAVTIETARTGGALHGEAGVRLVLDVDGCEALAPDGEAVGRAAEIVGHHGGALALEPRTAAGYRATIDLPGV
jgi:hypothetical protein